MSLLLGCSVLIICEFFDFLWESIKSRIRCPNEQNNVSSIDFFSGCQQNCSTYGSIEIINMDKTYSFTQLNNRNIMFYARLSKKSFVLFNMARDEGRPIATSSLAWPLHGLKSSLRSLKNT